MKARNCGKTHPVHAVCSWHERVLTRIHAACRCSTERKKMGKLTRYDFLGNKFVFFVLFFILPPFAILYFLRCSVIVEEEMENPSEFLEKWKSETAGRM
jgi:hypothetical protein